MERTAPRHTAGQAGVEPGEKGRLAFGFLPGKALFQQLGQGLLDLVGRLPEDGAFSGRKFRQAGHEFRHLALAAQKFHTAVFQFLRRSDFVQPLFKCGNQTLQLFKKIHDKP